MMSTNTMWKLSYLLWEYAVMQQRMLIHNKKYDTYHIMNFHLTWNQSVPQFPLLIRISYNKII